MYKKMIKRVTYLIIVVVVACIGVALIPHKTTSAQSTSPAPRDEVKHYTYSIVNTYSHSTSSYTQGLQYVDSQMWESTGLEGQSRLMRVDLLSGKQEVIKSLPRDEFGEGITHFGDSIFMITWQSNRAYIFDKNSGKVIDTKSYYGEGWGITTDGKVLYMSDGSSKITLRDPQTFEPTSTIDVTLEGKPINYLNELEWIEGRIWANIYTLDQIVIINPTSGVVEGVIDLSGILPASERTEQTDVLNGIAYCSVDKRIFVTGKNWSWLFEINIIER